MVHYRGGKAAIDPAVYPDLDSFWAGLTAAYRKQVTRLGELGCTYLQFDDTSLAYLNDPHQRRLRRFDRRRSRAPARGVHPPHQRSAGRPAGGHVGDDAHVPWQLPLVVGGHGQATTSSPRRSSTSSAVDGFFMEWDDERSGGFAPLRFLPKGKQVVLGLVTTKRGELEEKDAIKRRVEEASQHVDVDQLCLSPQCGFSSTVEGNALVVEQEIAKLRLVVDVAHEIWG